MMSMLQHIARAATMGAVAVLAAASLAAAEEGGRYWVPPVTNPARYWVPLPPTNPAAHSVPPVTNPAANWVPSSTDGAVDQQRPKISSANTRQLATNHMRKRSPAAVMARSEANPTAHATNQPRLKISPANTRG